MSQIARPSPLLLAAILSSASDRYAEHWGMSMITAVHRSAVHLAPHDCAQAYVAAITVVADQLGQRPEQWASNPADTVAVLWCCVDRLRTGGAR